MNNYRVVEKLIGAIEEEFEGYDIYIENNPDYFHNGFEWSICKDEAIWDSGLEFSAENAMQAAQNAILELLNPAL